MGLRETNATRTRQHIVDVAIDLFLEQGYDATTMEEVAERADIGTSTLYRYFPTKELLATAPFGPPELMAQTLRSRPADEAPEVALGQAVVTLLEHATLEGEERRAKYDRMIQQNHRSRARIMDWFKEAHDALGDALAERMDAPAGDPHVAATAWMAVFVLKQTGDQAALDRSAPIGDVAADVMATLASRPVVTPRLT
ncbi:hypothetical protein ASD11_09525 [Aeromicrobium sp. Root495]|uniref:TetR/AcrR family transcriptional regulator n=1 Tax=Aeromicrobium sp. Root495 TaxID=1736550 RepID=UPI0006F621EE|nr:TetR/AcrR family transcriptional regulator [Aeromicrobium sp. Root495]KQY59767.1 hypothetical protein ASD11_09525 [Aeromicrobium sp. Root495]